MNFLPPPLTDFAASGAEISIPWKEGISHPLIQRAGIQGIIALQNFYFDRNVSKASKDSFVRALTHAAKWLKDQGQNPSLALLADSKNAERYLKSIEGRAIHQVYRLALHYGFAHLVDRSVVKSNPFPKEKGGPKSKDKLSQLEPAFDAPAQRAIDMYLKEKNVDWQINADHTPPHFWALLKLSQWLEPKGLGYAAVDAPLMQEFLASVENETSRKKYTNFLGAVFERLVAEKLLEQNPLDVSKLKAIPNYQEYRYENLFTLLGQSGKAYIDVAEAFFGDGKKPWRTMKSLDHAAEWFLKTGRAEKISEITHHGLLTYWAEGFEGQKDTTREAYFPVFLQYLRHAHAQGLVAGMNNPASLFARGVKHIPPFTGSQPFTVARHEMQQMDKGNYDWSQSLVHLNQNGRIYALTAQEFLLATRRHYSAGLIEVLLNKDVSRNAIIGKLNRLKEDFPYTAAEKTAEVRQTIYAARPTQGVAKAASAKPRVVKAKATAPQHFAKPKLTPQPIPGLDRAELPEVYGPSCNDTTRLMDRAHTILSDADASYEDCLMLARYVHHFGHAKVRIASGGALTRTGDKQVGDSCWRLAERYGWVEMRNGSRRCADTFSALYNDPLHELKDWAAAFISAHERDMRHRFNYLLQAVRNTASLQREPEQPGASLQ